MTDTRNDHAARAADGRAANGKGASLPRLLKHEAAPASSGAVSRRDVDDELVASAAVRADEVDAEVINSGRDGVKGNFDAAANADPHGAPSAEGSGLHDRQSAEDIPGTQDAENSAVISADSAVNSGETGQ